MRPEPDDRSLGELIEDAAIEAEFATGRREPTVEAARSHVLVRVARMFAGAVVTIIGLALLVLPGPGLVVIAAGLALLAVDVPFARRLLDQVRSRLPADESGGSPRWLVFASIAACVTGTAASALFYLSR